MNPAIECRELGVDRGGRQVLRQLTFSVPAGSVTGLVGPSGCGKTTLMRSVVGVQIVTAGAIAVFGIQAGDPGLRRRIGYATQKPALYTDLTVMENLHYFAAVRGVPADESRRVLALVDLQGHARQLVAELSGGELSRTSLAVALLGRPSLLVLDEPTVGLDPVLRQSLWSLFHELAQEGTTLLISSHVMDEAARCEVLLLMRDGRILAQETPADLRRQTGSDDLEQAFLRLVAGQPKPE